MLLGGVGPKGDLRYGRWRRTGRHEAVRRPVWAQVGLHLTRAVDLQAYLQALQDRSLNAHRPWEASYAAAW